MVDVESQGTTLPDSSLGPPISVPTNYNETGTASPSRRDTLLRSTEPLYTDTNDDNPQSQTATAEPESSISDGSRSEKPPPSSEPFPPLKATATSLTTASSKEAALTLLNFPTSQANPRNWPRRKKWGTMLTVALTGFICTCGSSIGVPGIHQAMDEFGVDNEKIGILITSSYVLGLGLGPFLFAPISELYGRQTAYLTSQFLFILFCLGCAVSQNMQTLIILRFFSGMFGSSGPALGVATCADVFAPHERGRPISIYALGPMAGPVLGSMLGYWILFGGWRWLFWTITILSAINFALMLLFMRETYAPAIQKILVYRVRHPIADSSTLVAKLSPKRFIHDLGWMKVMVSAEDAKSTFQKAFSRPPRLLLTNPVAFGFSMYYAYIYAIIYVFLVSVPLLFGSPPFNRDGLFSYQWPQSILSLSYVGLGTGFLTAATIAATSQDKIYRYLSKRNGDGASGQPEYRLVLTQIGMILMPIGLLIFGWTAHAETHWIGPCFGQVFIAIGLMLAFNSIQNFIVDCFFPFSAAGIAGATACRSVLACLLPIFSGDLFHNLGWGYGGTLLACVGLLGVPAPAIMFVHGKKLRERFKFEG